jgi:hypothetical protein
MNGDDGLVIWAVKGRGEEKEFVLMVPVAQPHGSAACPWLLPTALGLSSEIFGMIEMNWTFLPITVPCLLKRVQNWLP